MQIKWSVIFNNLAFTPKIITINYYYQTYYTFSADPKYRKFAILKYVNTGRYKTFRKIRSLNFRDLVIVSTPFSLENQLFSSTFNCFGRKALQNGL